MAMDDTADIYLVGVDHRYETHARAVEELIREHDPNYVVREALREKTHTDVTDELETVGRGYSPQHLDAYIQGLGGDAAVVQDAIDDAMDTVTRYDPDDSLERSDPDVVLPDTAEELYTTPFVDMDVRAVNDIRDALIDNTADDAAATVVDETAVMLDEMMARKRSVNNAETYRVYGAVYDARQDGADTELYGADADTVHKATSATDIVQQEGARELTQFDTIAALAADADGPIVVSLGQEHLYSRSAEPQLDLADRLDLEFDVNRVFLPDDDRVDITEDEYEAYVLEQLTGRPAST